MAGASWGRRMKERLVGAGWVQDQVTHKKPCFFFFFLFFVREKKVRWRTGGAAADNGAIIALVPISQLPSDDRGSTRTCCRPPIVSG